MRFVSVCTVAGEPSVLRATFDALRGQSMPRRWLEWVIADPTGDCAEEAARLAGEARFRLRYLRADGDPRAAALAAAEGEPFVADTPTRLRDRNALRDQGTPIKMNE